MDSVDLVLDIYELSFKRTVRKDRTGITLVKKMPRESSNIDFQNCLSKDDRDHLFYSFAKEKKPDHKKPNVLFKGHMVSF